MPAASKRYVAIGEIARPHGLRGELRIRLYNEESTLLETRPPVRLRFDDGTERELRIVAVRPVNKAVLVTFAGVDDRNAAEGLRGAEVVVPRDVFPPPEDGAFYACDVEGARAVLRSSGEEIGTVRTIASYPTCDALVVDRKAGGPLEIPLVATFVGTVDADAGTVEILTLEGLLGETGSAGRPSSEGR